MIDVHSMKGSDVSRLLEEKQIVTSIDMSNDNKIFTYFPLGKIPLKLKLYIPTVDELILPQAKDDDDDDEDEEEEDKEAAVSSVTPPAACDGATLADIPLRSLYGPRSSRIDVIIDVIH